MEKQGTKVTTAAVSEFYNNKVMLSSWKMIVVCMCVSHNDTTMAIC